MPGIYVAAAITTLAVIAFYGSLLLRRADADERRGMLLAFAIALPLQPLAFYFVRMPLHGALLNALGPGALLSIIALFYAPLTEEPAKWLVLLARPVRRTMTPVNALAFALATGLGFGIGEIWFIAHQLTYSAGIAALPFYAFGGFFGERFVVCFLHGAFVSFAFQRLAERRAFLPGGLIGMALHFALNLPIFLGAIDLFGIGRPAWQLITLALMITMTAGLAAPLIGRAKGRLREVLRDETTCPECHAVYRQRWLSLNLGVGRYERCPNCRHFHWIGLGANDAPREKRDPA